jgi:hypothetical protein
MQFMFNNQMYWCHTFLVSDIQNILHSNTAVQECTKTIDTKQNTKEMPQWSKPETNDNILNKKKRSNMKPKIRKENHANKNKAQYYYKQPLLLHKHQNIM